jgi:Domain of Unknown Function (DUF1080)
MNTLTFSRRASTIVIAAGAVVVLAGHHIGARQTAPPPAVPAAPAAQGGGRAGGRGGTPPVPYDNYAGFTKLWDGSTFANWDGERDVWTIEDGTLHADTIKTPGQHHIHYIGPNAVMKDFDLKVEFKISAMGANGGVQYRSRLLHTVHGGTMADPMGKPTPAGITTDAQAIAAGITSNPPRGGGGGGNRPGAPGAGGAPAAGPPAAASAPAAAPNQVGRCGAGGPGPTSAPAIPTSTGNIWQVSGYQFDIDAANQYTGQLYEGQGRSIITAPGRFGRLMPDGADCSVLNPNPSSAVKPHLGKDGEWQQVEIIARGNTLVHILNGQVMSVTIDDNPDFRALQGILSLQLEGSGQIWYRNVYVKPLQ